jgi:hypothetical protein
MDWATIGTTIAALAAIVGLVAYYMRAVASVSERVACLESDNKVFWSVITPHLANLIHQSSAPRRDDLVQRFTDGKNLSREEMTEMMLLLQAVSEDPGRDPGKRLAAALLVAKAEMRINRLRERACDVEPRRWLRS